MSGARIRSKEEEHKIELLDKASSCVSNAAQELTNVFVLFSNPEFDLEQMLKHIVDGRYEANTGVIAVLKENYDCRDLNLYEISILVSIYKNREVLRVLRSTVDLHKGNSR